MTARPDPPLHPASTQTTQQPAPTADPTRDPGYRAGYQDGFATGVETGRAWAERDMADAWRELATHVRRSADAPSHADLKHRRDQYPTPARTPAQILAAARASSARFEAEA